MGYLRVALVILTRIILVPFKFLNEIVGRSAPTLARYVFTWGQERCYIETNSTPKGIDHDTLLIYSYIVFLHQYFYICDPKQVPLMKDYLAQHTDTIADDIFDHVTAVYDLVLSTLTAPERDAAEALCGAVPPGAFGYIESRIPERPWARYSLRVFEGFTSQFNMSSGPDIILLPATVLVFYQFVVEKLRDPDRKRALDQLIHLTIAPDPGWNLRELRTMLQRPRALFNRAPVSAASAATD